jgi:hypothetical protein
MIVKIIIIPARMIIKKDKNNINSICKWRGREKRILVYAGGRNVNWYSHFGISLKF